MKNILVITFTLVLLLCPEAESKDNEKKETKAQDGAAQIDVSNIREKYWAKGDKASMGVVQNRLFSKAGKFQLGLLGGITFSDPFLSVNTLGLNFGYHFNEYLGASLVAWKHFVGPSSALESFRASSGATANTNEPRVYVGAEMSGSLLYGKLSVLGASIIYFDLHVDGGIGATVTETGTYFTPSVGLGQRFYITQNFSLRLDYRLMFYEETIVEKVIPTRLGQPIGVRSNFSNNVTLGVDFMFGGK